MKIIDTIILRSFVFVVIKIIKRLIKTVLILFNMQKLSPMIKPMLTPFLNKVFRDFHKSMGVSISSIRQCR